MIVAPAEFDVLDPPAPIVADLAGKMLWFARLAKAKREQDERLEQIKSRMSELEPHLLEEMAVNGIEKQTVEGMTIFPRTDLRVWKKSVSTQEVCEALRQCGWGDMVSDGYSAAALTGRIRELRSEGLDIHPVLEALLNVVNEVSLRAVKG